MLSRAYRSNSCVQIRTSVAIRPFRSLAQAGTEYLSGRVLDRLVSRELVQPEPLHYFGVSGAEALIVLLRTPCGTSGIDQTTLGDHPPVLHLFGDQDFSNLRSCIHVKFSSFCAETCGLQTWSGTIFLNDNGKSLTQRSTHSVHLRLTSVGLKVRELTFNSSAMSSNNGFGSSQATKVMGQVVLRKTCFYSGELRRSKLQTGGSGLRHCHLAPESVPRREMSGISRPRGGTAQ